jgi:hypothetical protein
VTHLVDNHSFYDARPSTVFLNSNADGRGLGNAPRSFRGLGSVYLSLLAMDSSRRKRPMPLSIQTISSSESRRDSFDISPGASTPGTGYRKRFFSNPFRHSASQPPTPDGPVSATSDSGAAQMRRLPKGSGQNSLMDRLNRRVSKDSTSSSQSSSEDRESRCGSRLSWDGMQIVKYGALKAQDRLLKSRTGYAVLTDEYLVKFNSAENAVATFPQLDSPHRHGKGATPTTSSGTNGSDGQVAVPLGKLVSVFNEEGNSLGFGLEVWWFNSSPAIGNSNLKLFFATPLERDDWVSAIFSLGKLQSKAYPLEVLVPSLVRRRIQNEVAAEEPETSGWALDIFPVVQRTIHIGTKRDTNESAKKSKGSSSYIVLGQYFCYLIRVSHTRGETLPENLCLHKTAFGIASLVRFRATLSPREERFVISFR